MAAWRSSRTRDRQTAGGATGWRTATWHHAIPRGRYVCAGRTYRAPLRSDNAAPPVELLSRTTDTATCAVSISPFSRSRSRAQVSARLWTIIPGFQRRLQGAPACGRRSPLDQTPHVGQKSGEQRGQVFLSPDESQWQRQLEVGDFQYRHAVGTSPAGGFHDETHAHALSDECQYRRFVRSFLNDPRRFQAATETFVHQAVVECRALAPRKPDETRVRHVAQPEVLDLAERMRGRSRQGEAVHGDRQLIHLPIRFRRVEHEPGIQPAGSNGLELLQTRQRVQLQFGVGMALSEEVQRVGYHAPP